MDLDIGHGYVLDMHIIRGGNIDSPTAFTLVDPSSVGSRIAAVKDMKYAYRNVDIGCEYVVDMDI